MYFANEKMSLEEKVGEERMYMCCTVGDAGMDWGQAGERRKQLAPLCYIWFVRRWLVCERNTLFGGSAHECETQICTHTCRAKTAHESSLGSQFITAK